MSEPQERFVREFEMDEDGEPSEQLVQDFARFLQAMCAPKDNASPLNSGEKQEGRDDH